MGLRGKVHFLGSLENCSGLPIVLIELFLLGVTGEALRANIDWKLALWKGIGQFRLNFHEVGDVPRKPFLHG